MKYICFFALLLMLGCSSQQDIIQSNHAENVYFSTVDGGVYEYSGTISKVSNLPVNSIQLTSSSALYASTQSLMSLINPIDSESEYIESEDRIIASAISEKASFIYYFNQFGELKLYNRNTHESLTTSIKVYPLPKQVVFCEKRQLLFFTIKKVYLR